MGVISRLRRGSGALVASMRAELSRSTLSLFEYAPYPLANTLEYQGDPGLLGPGSVSWHLLADPAAFIGGIRGLLIQSAHPEVVAGVDDHSRYREDPLGRLSRTSAYVTATTFGAMPEVQRAVENVQRVHRVVKGKSNRGIAYDAADPGFSAWVHNALTDSFLRAHQTYGAIRLTEDEADLFVLEQTRVGSLLGADPMPTTAGDLATWVAEHPGLETSRATQEVVDFLTDPPLSPGIRVGYLALLEAALAIVPPQIRRVLGVTPRTGAVTVGKAAVAGLRWALGYSPSWALALRRTGSEIPDGLFRRRFDQAVAS